MSGSTTAQPRHATGIDGCPGGWVAARLIDGSVTWATTPVDGIGELVRRDSVTGIDMPIGLLDAGRRDCDALARGELPGASARVFTTPPRAVLELGPMAPNEIAQDTCRNLMGVGVSRQALHLAPRILALDALLAADRSLVAVEVHPELSFAALAGRVLDRKASPDGRQQRRDALRPWLHDVDRLLAERPRGVPVTDALDALAALWSAVRWRDGLARTLPGDAAARPFIAI